MKNTKKLSLNKQTIRNLSDETLDQVNGGNGDSAGVICIFSVLIICGDSIICSVLAGACNNENGD
ncbi:class I lanthipeptide [Archangium primigenium]|jgi:hypothetical protein|uniref:class I lanthipeptide n=1 Tax=Melittangium TaxID=44 RepID=UPI00195B9430|nr:class I lanthipeptide [Archangium primigenium]MBM7118473.1 class I lanthipeptide [Archangium primigenium]